MHRSSIVAASHRLTGRRSASRPSASIATCILRSPRCVFPLVPISPSSDELLQQVHKLPGTVYATVGTASPTTTDTPDSFKSKMERLKDPGSTNLYMEGLPLSIDEASLAALVTPFRIMSSRLFQTRLSNPPRIIAFVRYAVPHVGLYNSKLIPAVIDSSRVTRRRKSLNACTAAWSAGGTILEAGSLCGLPTPRSRGSFAYVIIIGSATHAHHVNIFSVRSGCTAMATIRRRV